jgi:hypothetical protein
MTSSAPSTKDKPTVSEGIDDGGERRRTLKLVGEANEPEKLATEGD